VRTFAVVVAALVFVPTAPGALGARLAIAPRSPLRGVAATISLFPYFPYLRADGSCCRNEPADVNYPWRLQLLVPGGRRIALRPRHVEPYRYAARVTFHTRGRWEIRIANGYESRRDEHTLIRYHGPRLYMTVR